MGFKLKLNTVVSEPNKDDDMTELIKRLRPDRWKVFKVLPVAGQNDGPGHTGAPTMQKCGRILKYIVARELRLLCLQT
jgi:radical S-adenosyl methionine domain-containing protein 2